MAISSMARNRRFFVNELAQRAALCILPIVDARL